MRAFCALRGRGDLTEIPSAQAERVRLPAAEHRGCFCELTLNGLGAAQDQWLRCEPVRQLQQNLGLERQATFSFCFAWLDEVGTADEAISSTLPSQQEHAAAKHFLL